MSTKRPHMRLRHADAALDGAARRCRRAGAAPSRTSRRRCGARPCAPRACVSPGVARRRRSCRAARAGPCRASRPARRSPARARRRPAAWPGARNAAAGPALVKTSYCSERTFGHGYSALRRSPTPGAGRDAAGAVALEVDRGERAVLLRAELELLHRVGPVADATGAPRGGRASAAPARRAFFDRCVASTPKLPDAELRAEPAAHELGDDAHLALRQVEHRRQLVARRCEVPCVDA